VADPFGEDANSSQQLRAPRQLGGRARGPKTLVYILHLAGGGLRQVKWTYSPWIGEQWRLV
jgi:hypothetical protein